jgi:hypothetical protein
MARWNACAALAALALAVGGCSDRGKDAEGERSSKSTPRQKARRQAEESSQAYERAAEEQKALAAQPRGSGERSVSGSVVRASAEELVLRQEGGLPDLRLKVDASTPVVLDGKQASVAELREGTQVRASYGEVNGEPRATRIEAHGVGAGTQR